MSLLAAATVAQRVAFYATSERIARAFRIAAKRNKSLAHFAGMQELGQSASVAKNHGGSGMVVLSHADDGDFTPVGKRAESVYSEAFHLLFTGPETHPDRVAHWMRSSKIRSEDRLHVMKVDDLEAISVSQLLGRVCTALGGPGDRGGIIDAYFAGTSLLVRGSKHRMLHVPLEKLHPLQRLPEPVVRNIVIDPDGSFLHWPEPDVHLGWDQFLQAVDPIEFLKAEQRNAGYNARYGRAIRKVRETAGIRQSQVGGLTDRQVRRIESGVCRASTAALNALAKAHALDVNAYLERVASAIPQG